MYIMLFSVIKIFDNGVFLHAIKYCFHATKVFKKLLHAIKV